MIMQHKRLIGIMLGAVALLLIPFITMQFTSEVQWTGSDFAVAAALLFGTGLVSELVMRKIHRLAYRILICAVILALFLLIWIELAVGIFGSPLAGS